SALALVTVLSARSVLRASLRSTIAEGGGTTAKERRAFITVAAQVAIAFVVTVAGALVAGSLLRVSNEDPGFDTKDAVLIGMSSPAGMAAADIEELASSVGRVPGVVQAGATEHIVLARGFNGSVFDRPEGIPPDETGVGKFPIESVAISHGYLEAS